MSPYNIESLPALDIGTAIDYKIAYIALCIENSESGRNLLDNLREITNTDTKYIQFGSAEWFWNKQVNSYALQVEPLRYQNKDRITIDYREALHIEKVRNRFWDEIRIIIEA